MMNNSITKRITFSSILVVVAGLLLTLLVSAYILYQQNYSQIHENAQTLIDNITRSMTEPLWSLDEQAITALCEQYINNPHIKELSVYYLEDTQPIYQYSQTIDTESIQRSRHEIYYRNHHIGRIEIAWSYTGVTEGIYQNLFLICFVTFILSLLMSIAIKYSVARELKSPLQKLASWARLIARGDYKNRTDNIREDELQTLVHHFQSMAETIRNREETLKKLSNATEKSPACIVITDASERIDYVNKAFEHVMGYSQEEILGKPLLALQMDFYRDLWNRVFLEGEWQGEINAMRKDNRQITLWLLVKSMLDENGKPNCLICTFTDITEQKMQQRRLEYLALHDPLTNLANRELLKERFEEIITANDSDSHRVVVVFIDLDHFKTINDQYGHSVGDQILIHIAERLRNYRNDQDVVARFGGDEFILILEDIIDETHCTMVLEKLKYLLSQPCRIGEISHSVGCTMGAAFCHNEKSDLDTLIRQCDQTMYQAKLAGRNRISIYNPDIDEQYILKQQLLNRLQDAIAHHEFELHYQPKVNLVTGEVLGAEALIRWNHPDKGLVFPDDFLNVAYGSHIEYLIGTEVIKMAVEQLEILKSQGIDIGISINISPQQLQSPHFMEDLDAILSMHPTIDPSRLQFEILESTSLSNSSHISEILKLCNSQYGITAALDDFGTGYSSLTHLKDLPIDTVKIDRSFVRDMIDDRNDNAIVHAIIGLSESFSINVVAEGVETIEQGVYLIKQGCYIAQGYCIARPLKQDLLPEWITQFQSPLEWKEANNIYPFQLQ